VVKRNLSTTVKIVALCKEILFLFFYSTREKMEVSGPSGTKVNLYQTTPHYTPDDK